MIYEFDEAPYDILGEHELIGRVVVAKKGAQLPLITSWKISEGVSVAVKFSVSRNLAVSVSAVRESPSANLSSTPSSATRLVERLLFVPQKLVFLQSLFK